MPTINIKETKQKNLSSDEMKRLDDLLTAARNFNYTSFVLAGLSLMLSSLEKVESISVPVFNIAIPSLQAVVSIYLLVIIFTLTSDRLFAMAYPWLDLDKRRPQFAWIALGPNRTNLPLVLFWLVIPLLICAIATANTLTALSQKDVTGLTLSFAGIFVIFAPRVVGRYWNFIQERTDLRGGPATFSIYLLYWLRITRQILGSTFFFLPVLAIIPKWRPTILQMLLYLLFGFVAFEVIRLIGSIPFIYRFIDKSGVRFGFPAKSKHYK